MMNSTGIVLDATEAAIINKYRQLKRQHFNRPFMFTVRHTGRKSPVQVFTMQPVKIDKR